MRVRSHRSGAKIAGWSSPVAREAHNLEVAGSNPVPATNDSGQVPPEPANSGRAPCATRGSVVSWRLLSRRSFDIAARSVSLAKLGSVLSVPLRGNERLMDEPGRLLAHHKAGATGYEAESFRPITPATINNRQTTRAAVTGSPNRTMPRIAVPTAPMPVQTA